MTPPLRVLHLEDSARDAEVLRHKLDVEGVSCDILVVNSKDGFEAALSQKAFDLIISDYTLPGYDGITALKHAQASQPDVPVILVSGTVGEEEAVKCLHIGATDYLLKARLDRLVPAVQRAIEEAETRRNRKRAEAALVQSEARKAAVLDSVLDSIITMDADGMVIEFNAAAERTFGYTKAEAIGRALADLIIPPAHRRAHSAGLARDLATSAGPLIGKLIEIVAMRSDGCEIPVELSITPVLSDKAPIFTGVLRDLTSRKKAEAELKRLNDEIQVQRLRVFRATMRTVHDIVNNFLTSLQFAHIEAEGELTGEMQTLVDRMIREAAAKLKTLGELETVTEKEMAIGIVIEYPGSAS